MAACYELHSRSDDKKTEMIRQSQRVAHARRHIDIAEERSKRPPVDVDAAALRVFGLQPQLPSFAQCRCPPSTAGFVLGLKRQLFMF